MTPGKSFAVRLIPKLFGVAWLFVLAVSVYDGYLLLYCRDVIQATERNPVGQVLLQMAGGSVWLFLVVKTLGTLFVCMALLVAYRTKPTWGIPITFALATFQFALLMYLSFR